MKMLKVWLLLGGMIFLGFGVWGAVVMFPLLLDYWRHYGSDQALVMILAGSICCCGALSDSGQQWGWWVAL
jgi:hypothetical protein